MDISKSIIHLLLLSTTLCRIRWSCSECAETYSRFRMFEIRWNFFCGGPSLTNLPTYKQPYRHRSDQMRHSTREAARLKTRLRHFTTSYSSWWILKVPKEIQKIGVYPNLPTPPPHPAPRDWDSNFTHVAFPAGKVIIEKQKCVLVIWSKLHGHISTYK